MSHPPAFAALDAIGYGIANTDLDGVANFFAIVALFACIGILAIFGCILFFPGRIVFKRFGADGIKWYIGGIIVIFIAVYIGS